jgi:hypothetical protein
MSPERGRVLLYGLQILSALVQDSDLERRIAVLERAGGEAVQ